MENKTKQLTQEISIPIIESNKDGFWEIYPDRKVWHSAVKSPINMPDFKRKWDFVSPFVRGADLPEGEPVKFEVRKDKETNECWGWRESKSQYGSEVIFPDGTKKLIDFFVNLYDNQGQEKIWTRSSQTFWRQLEKLDLKVGDTVNLIRIGEEKQARYNMTLAERAEIEATEEEKAAEKKTEKTGKPMKKKE